MGRIVAQSIGGIAIKLALAATIVYAGVHTYGFVTHAFAPASTALDGALAK